MEANFDSAVRWAKKSGANDPDNLVQKTLIEAHRHYQAARGNFGPLLWKILRRRFSDELRQTYRREITVPLESVDRAELTVESPPCADELGSFVRKLLVWLPSGKFGLLRAHYLHGISLCKLAVRHGTTECAMKQRLWRVRGEALSRLNAAGYQSFADVEMLGESRLLRRIVPSRSPSRCRTPRLVRRRHKKNRK